MRILVHFVLSIYFDWSEYIKFLVVWKFVLEPMTVDGYRLDLLFWPWRAKPSFVICGLYKVKGVEKITDRQKS